MISNVINRNMKRFVFFPLMILFITFSDGFGQSCNDLKAIIDKTYGFKPSKLTSEQIDAKSSELDKVWALVDSNQKELLPCLRSEISLRRSDTFFRFNTSNLLFNHDPSIETKKLMIETYSEADLADINLRFWLPYMAAFALEGLDVSKAGETWLRFPNPVYYLPQHGTRPVDKGVGALAIFGSMDEATAMPAIASLVAQENTDFRNIAIWLLVKQATPEADNAVIALSSKLPQPLSDRLKKDVSSPELVVRREEKPKTSRDQFVGALNDLLDDKPDAWITLTVEVPDGERDMVAVLEESDLPLIRRVRRYYASKATPHSPAWYETFTQVINTIRIGAKSKATDK